MTLPQQRLPGATYFITACCDRRQARLPPEPETNAAIAVALAEASERYGVKLVCICTVMNHYHAVVYDEHGKLPEFLRDVHALVARFGNARDEAPAIGFWDRQPVDAQQLGDVAAVVRKVAYCLANPTTSRLVSRPERWPGLRTRVEDLGRWRGPIFERPRCFFDPKGWVSESVELVSELPPELEVAVGIERFQSMVADAIERLVEGTRLALRESGGRFMGLAKVRSIGVWDAPGTPSPRRVGRAAVARRRVAAADPAIARAMVAALVAFWQLYRRGLALIQRGVRAVVPAGAWEVWRYYGAERTEGRASLYEAPS